MKNLLCSIALLMLPIATALAASEDTEQRFSEIVRHISAHPVNELPIGKHPKKPQQTFCRLFNISLSARAYFQLMTDPGLDNQSSQMLAKVATWYLNNPDRVADPDSAYWAGEYHSAILAKFGSQGTDRPGAIAPEVERLMLEYMWSYVNYWSRLEHYEASLKYQTYYYWSTENHWWQEIVASWGYLLALKDAPGFADRKLDDGRSIQDHYDQTVNYMKQHMQQRARKGFLLEISSGGYSSRMHNMWLLIHEIAPENDLRLLAKNTLDLWWTFFAEEQIAAERGGGKVRHRKLRGLRPNTERHLVPAWLYFGIGTLDRKYIESIKPDTTELAMHYIVLLSAYRPDEVVYNIIEDRPNAPPYEIVQRRQGKVIPDDEVPEIEELGGGVYDVDNGDVLKYSWVTPHYILGTNMRPPHNGYVWNRGAAQGWWHGLVISGGSEHAPPERVVPTFILNGRDISSDQYAVQSKGSFMTRKIPDKVWGKDNASIPMGAFLSSGLRHTLSREGDFLFIENPRAWVAVRAVGTRFIEANELLETRHRRLGVFYNMENDHMPMVIEVASPGDYTNFSAFRKAAQEAELQSSDGKHSYSSLAGDELAMYDDRSRPEIDGQPINYNPSTVYKSRYVHAEWDSGTVSISARGVRKALDFMMGSSGSNSSVTHVGDTP